MIPIIAGTLELPEAICLEYADKYVAREYERGCFLAARDVIEPLFYTPKVMLLNDGYACQCDGLAEDFSYALEIKTLNAKGFERLAGRESAVLSRYKKIIFRYFLANPYLGKLTVLVLNRGNGDFLCCDFDRPDRYNRAIKRPHDDARKIKGDYSVIDLGRLSFEAARVLLCEYATADAELQGL
ncbi:MAG: hypothetical protein HFJ66_09805 [Eggerthellaceae bacterium]|nr:hypothetical protein [Eggerthellaceae bacterium]